MPRIKYQDIALRGGSLEIVEQANQIIAEYQAQGFDLTLRQLYYQFVARDIIPNKDTEYKRLGSIINDARLAGLIDWSAIQDRTRNLRALGHWEKPQDILESAAYSYKLDAWADQDYRPEVWLEKDALVGVIVGVCEELDVPYFSCRGYTSQSEMWAAGQRLARYKRGDQTPVIIHLGDHDPSGIDMTRDITDRLALFTYGEIQVDRIALNMDQIQQYDPPPNPAKITDSRATAYIAQFGYESWELDALSPTVMADLIRGAILQFRDEDLYREVMRRERQAKTTLRRLAANWDTTLAALNGHTEPDPDEESDDEE